MSNVRQFVLKIASRCNLACKYCYEYEHPDQSWRSQATVMAEKTMRCAAARIGQELEDGRLAHAGIVLHGGEPLLAGPRRIENLVGYIRAKAPQETHLSFTMQTNGTLLAPKTVEMLQAQQVKVGVSLDGSENANQARVYRNGSSTHDETVSGINLLRATDPTLFAGILSVVDLSSDPLDVYQYALSLQPPAIDFLLPHHNWAVPPKRTGYAAADYGTWLSRIFDAWYRAPKKPCSIRIFETIIQQLLLGPGSVGYGNIGTVPNSHIVIDTNGQYHLSDALKTTFEGASKLRGSIFNMSISQALSYADPVYLRRSVDLLCAQCQACDVVGICGGGSYAHRYSIDGQFDNPSVYCQDLYALIQHIARIIWADIGNGLVRNGQ